MHLQPKCSAHWSDSQSYLPNTPLAFSNQNLHPVFQEFLDRSPGLTFEKMLLDLKDLVGTAFVYNKLPYLADHCSFRPQEKGTGIVCENFTDTDMSSQGGQCIELALKAYRLIRAKYPEVPLFLVSGSSPDFEINGYNHFFLILPIGDFEVQDLLGNVCSVRNNDPGVISSLFFSPTLIANTYFVLDPTRGIVGSESELTKHRWVCLPNINNLLRDQDLLVGYLEDGTGSIHTALAVSNNREVFLDLQIVNGLEPSIRVFSTTGERNIVEVFALSDVRLNRSLENYPELNEPIQRWQERLKIDYSPPHLLASCTLPAIPLAPSRQQGFVFPEQSLLSSPYPGQIFVKNGAKLHPAFERFLFYSRVRYSFSEIVEDIGDLLKEAGFVETCLPSLNAAAVQDSQIVLKGMRNPTFTCTAVVVDDAYAMLHALIRAKYPTLPLLWQTGTEVKYGGFRLRSGRLLIAPNDKSVDIYALDEAGERMDRELTTDVPTFPEGPKTVKIKVHTSAYAISAFSAQILPFSNHPGFINDTFEISPFRELAYRDVVLDRGEEPRTIVSLLHDPKERIHLLLHIEQSSFSILQAEPEGRQVYSLGSHFAEMPDHIHSSYFADDLRRFLKRFEVQFTHPDSCQ